LSYSKAELEGFLREAGLGASEAGKRVSAYSKGMRQKVGIALAMAKKAKALLLDEPTSGLDPKASNEVFGVAEAVERRGCGDPDGDARSVPCEGNGQPGSGL
jgi:ABC-2 type transport system ATP-binding protein